MREKGSRSLKDMSCAFSRWMRHTGTAYASPWELAAHKDSSMQTEKGTLQVISCGVSKQHFGLSWFLKSVQLRNLKQEFSKTQNCLKSKAQGIGRLCTVDVVRQGP